MPVDALDDVGHTATPCARSVTDLSSFRVAKMVVAWATSARHPTTLTTINWTHNLVLLRSPRRLTTQVSFYGGSTEIMKEIIGRGLGL